MSGAAWALQQAIYGHLTRDDALKSELGTPMRIYDNAPIGAVFPFLLLGEGRISDWQGVTGGFEHDLRLHAFSRYAGRREVKRIMGALYDALHDASLTLHDHQLINMRFVFGDVFRRQDRETYQGVARFRAVTQPL